ncbi:MAG: PQQ-dependent sugar dehydrogenase [Halioglobus sp.]
MCLPSLLVGVVVVLVVAVAAPVDWNSLALRTWLAAGPSHTVDDPPHRESDGGVDFVATAVVDSLDMPWSVAFLPDGDVLLTERSGGLKRANLRTGDVVAIDGVPEVHYKGQGGLLDVAPHPDFDSGGWVYLTYSAPLDDGSSATRLARARLRGDALVDFTVLYTTEVVAGSNKHYGGRLLFDGDYLFMTMGERGQRYRSQDLDSDLGKLLRFNRDGSIPDDNPFAGVPNAKPAIYSYGHRNPQGLARHPATGEIWVTEHGPQGGDELNRIVPGANYGWPVVTYGEEYGGGKIGEGTHRDDMEHPVYHYVPSIATGGLAFYTGDQFPAWEGDALITALRAFHLNRVSIAPDGSAAEYSLLQDLNLRLRDVKVGPEGHVYVVAEQGSLVRLSPDA